MNKLLLLGALLATLAGYGCANDTALLNSADAITPLVGTWKSTTFILTSVRNVADTVGSRGGSITISLGTNRTVQGHLLIPADSSQTIDIDLHGSFAVSGDTVRFATNAAWPIDALTWIHNGNELQSAPIAGDPTMIVLSRL